MTPKNIPEFIALIKRYESITLEEIEAVKNIETLKYLEYGYCIASELTGFGSMATCLLCKGADSVCENCVYRKSEGCHLGHMEETYDKIWDARYSNELLFAFRNRATAMRQYAVNIGINIE